MDDWLKAIFAKQEEIDRRLASDADALIQWKNFLSAPDAQSFGFRCTDDGIQLVVAYKDKPVFNVRVEDGATVISEAQPGGRSHICSERDQAIDRMASLAVERMRYIARKTA